jgi:hypothetical protein
MATADHCSSSLPAYFHANTFFLLYNSDAPALSRFFMILGSQSYGCLASAEITECSGQVKTAEQWDDEALAAATYKRRRRYQVGWMI